MFVTQFPLSQGDLYNTKLLLENSQWPLLPKVYTEINVLLFNMPKDASLDKWADRKKGKGEKAHLLLASKNSSAQ